MLQVRPVPVCLNIGPPPRVAHAHPHRPEAVCMRTMRSVLPTEAAAQAPSEPLPQPDLRAAAASRENTRVC